LVAGSSPPEGVAESTDFTDVLAHRDPAEIRLVMRDSNAPWWAVIRVSLHSVVTEIDCGALLTT
jgi:hypothetical protein